MFGEFNRWFIKSRPVIFIGAWVLWLLSPFLIIGNLEVLRSLFGIPDEVMRFVNLLFAVVWLPGVLAFAVLVILGLRVAPGDSGDASKEQLDYERRRR